MAAPRNNATVILFVLVLVIIVATGVLLYMQLRTDEVRSHIASGEVVRSLIIAYDEDSNKPLITFVLFFHPETERAAILDIPGNIGAVLRPLNRVDRIDTVFDPIDVAPFRREIERLIGTEIPYTLLFSSEQLVGFIDLLGGMELFIINDYRQINGSDPVLLPTGNVRLDGEKAVQYVQIEDPIETELERIGKRQSFVQALLRAIRSSRRILTHPEVVEVRSGLIETSLDQRSVTTLLEALARIDPERIVRRRVQGTVRSVDVEGEARQLLFPHFEGQWLKQAVQQVEQTLASTEEEIAEQVTVSVEILNGTSSSGLARRTSEMYEDYGFEVRRFGNAESNQIERTIVIDRRGIGNTAKQVAQVIRAQRIVTEVQPNTDVDVTIVLGRDFDGSVVRTDE